VDASCSRSSFPHDLTLTAAYGSSETARTIERSLRQEIGEIDDDRSRTTLDREGSDLRIAVGAADLLALRAASNTWLSLLSVAETVATTGDRVG